MRSGVALSGDGQILVSGGGKSTIKIWDLRTGQERQTLTGHQKAVRCVALSGDGKILVSGSDDRTINVWNV